jgi:hypothetical protein
MLRIFAGNRCTGPARDVLWEGNCQTLTNLNINMTMTVTDLCDKFARVVYFPDVASCLLGENGSTELMCARTCSTFPNGTGVALSPVCRQNLSYAPVVIFVFLIALIVVSMSYGFIKNKNRP